MLFLITAFISCLEYKEPGEYEIYLKAGQYNISCYGAQGGGSYVDNKKHKDGGKGAFVTGILNVTGKGIKLISHVGGEGATGNENVNAGGYNGGADSGADTGGDWNGLDVSGGGGGATDIRTEDNSTESRIIVAAGGSGAAGYCSGAPGGCLYGYYAKDNEYFLVDSEVGQNIRGKGANSGSVSGSGGGGGYRGGPSTGSGCSKDNGYEGVARSGCSYLSGYGGCENHSKLVFTLGYMAPGYQSGNGKISIKNISQCSPNCASCSDSNTCHSCYEGFLHNNICVDNCPDGFYGLNNKCEKCQSSCLTCTDSSVCLLCQSGYFLKDGKCNSICPSGHYKDSESGQCKNCEEPCEKCTSKETCLTCIDKYVFYENQCISSCPIGTVNTGHVCEKCHPFCATCFPSVKECTSCQDGYFLHENTCVASCPDQTFELNKQCVKCRATCKTCNSNDHCTTCIDGFYLHGNECVNKCPDGTTLSGVVCI